MDVCKDLTLRLLSSAPAGHITNPLSFSITGTADPHLPQKQRRPFADL